jgi:transcriptional regulator with XRE-family HTH domain
MESLGERLKELRREKKLTQEQLAKALDKIQQTIYKYEKNTLELSVNEIKELKQKYPDLNTEWLITGNGDMLIKGDSNIVGDNNSITINKDNSKTILQREVEILEAFKKLPPERATYYYHKIIAESME